MDLVVPPGPGVPGGLTVPAGELVERFSRSSGPGGQGVNTADSRVEIELDVVSCPAFTDTQRQRVLRALDSQLVGGRLLVWRSGGSACTTRVRGLGRRILDGIDRRRRRCCGAGPRWRNPGLHGGEHGWGGGLGRGGLTGSGLENGRLNGFGLDRDLGDRLRDDLDRPRPGQDRRIDDDLACQVDRRRIRWTVAQVTAAHGARRLDGLDWLG